MKPYTSYKPSSVPWLGEVPAHWVEQKVKHIARFNTGWTPPTGDAASYMGTNFWANIGDLGAAEIEETKHCISDEAATKAGIALSPVGSLLFSFKLSVGQVSVAKVPLYTNEAIATFPPQDGFETSWAFFAFPEFIPKNAVVNIYGAQLLNQQRINDAVLPVPPKVEQQAIADYLDTETARIDELMREKESLIGLLREYRQSVIAETVLKGLNPAVRLKHSGVPWLGEVPAHWVEQKVKHIARFNTGWTPPTGDAASYMGTNFWANIGDLGAAEIEETKHCISDEAATKAGIALSPVGSLLFSFKLSVGQVSVAKVPLYTNEAIATFPPQDGFETSWAFFAFPEFIPKNAVVNIYGAQLLNQQRINDAVLLVPPKVEQQAIADYLDIETARIDDLITHTHEEINLFKELRAATIADAVTGKIQVS